jgi:hypothetical protein
VGFKEVKYKVITALSTGNFQHEVRDQIEVKNILAMGQISVAEVINIIKQSRGDDHETSPHHLDKTIDVHIITTTKLYIKFYFLDPDTWFISVHP